MKIGGGGSEGEDLRSGALIERFEHGPRHKPACTGHRVVCLVPRATFRDLANDIEEVALLERELLRSGGTITAGGTDNLLRRGDGIQGF
jgi:hypothetical protein